MTSDGLWECYEPEDDEYMEPDSDALCEDCPPVVYPTDKTRRGTCPRRNDQ